LEIEQEIIELIKVERIKSFSRCECLELLRFLQNIDRTALKENKHIIEQLEIRLKELMEIK
jgi:hypothetical protein